MTKQFLILTTILLCSCANGPTVVMRPDGTVIANLGQQLFEDSDEETAMITLPDGTKLAYSKTGKKQTKVPNNYIGYKLSVGLANIANGGEEIREKGDTLRTQSADSVKKAKIQADVTKATFVPPE